mgnify:CR=1 FL=1
MAILGATSLFALRSLAPWMGLFSVTLRADTQKSFGSELIFYSNK